MHLLQNEFYGCITITPGAKALCAGQDLTEHASSRRSPNTAAQLPLINHPPTEFMGLSQRKGKTPLSLLWIDLR